MITVSRPSNSSYVLVEARGLLSIHDIKLLGLELVSCFSTRPFSGVLIDCVDATPVIGIEDYRILPSYYHEIGYQREKVRTAIFLSPLNLFWGPMLRYAECCNAASMPTSVFESRADALLWVEASDGK